MVSMLDQPHAMGTELTCFVASQYISEHYPDIRVVLNGNASDELFLGYSRYRRQATLRFIYQSLSLIP